MVLDLTATVITPGFILGLFIVGLYGAMKYGEQTWGPDPKKWSTTKYFQILAVALGVSLIGYLMTGILEVATIEQITSVAGPAFELLGAAVLGLLGIKYSVNIAKTGSLTATTGTPAGESASAAPASAGGDTIEAFGFTVIPAFLEGKSPFIAIAKVMCSQTVSAISIEWTDGALPQVYNLVKEGGYAVANIGHQYTFIPDGKYTGLTYYPEITVIGKNGKKQVFNTEETGRCLSIHVMGA